VQQITLWYNSFVNRWWLPLLCEKTWGLDNLHIIGKYSEYYRNHYVGMQAQKCLFLVWRLSGTLKLS